MYTTTSTINDTINGDIVATAGRVATFPAYYLGRPAAAYQRRYRRDVTVGRARP